MFTLSVRSNPVRTLPAKAATYRAEESSNVRPLVTTESTYHALRSSFLLFVLSLTFLIFSYFIPSLLLFSFFHFFYFSLLKPTHNTKHRWPILHKRNCSYFQYTHRTKYATSTYYSVLNRGTCVPARSAPPRASSPNSPATSTSVPAAPRAAAGSCSLTTARCAASLTRTLCV